MSLYDELPLTDFDRKVRDSLGDKVVVKSLAQNTAFQGLPRYVSEYLIAKFVQPATWRDDLVKVQTKIKELLPDLERRELKKEALLRLGELTLIDNIEARIDLKNGERWVRVPAIQDDKVRVGSDLLSQHPGLLLGGLWGTAKLKYSPEEHRDAPNELVSFTPFQVGPPDLVAYKAARSKFTSEEWLQLIMNSAGYDARSFPERRHRLLLMTRLVPLVERNVNLLELGPRQTGKTFLLRNVSPRVFTISGGRTTPANLFVNLSTRAVGILGTRKVVVFDEIAHTTFGDEDATISTLKDFMESGQFSRGALSFNTDASLVFTGNLDVQGDQPDPGYTHLFEPLPRELIDTALQDRMHGYLPGWEIPKITPGSLAQGVGFVTDYFGEVLTRLREDNHHDRVRQISMHPGMTRRDQASVERLSSGLIKLLYPDGNMTEAELMEVVVLAAEYRQRIHNQLNMLAPGEFKAKLIGPRALIEHEADDLNRSLPESSEDPLSHEAAVGAVTGLGTKEKDGKTIGVTFEIQVTTFPDSSGKVQVTGRHGADLKDSVLTAYNIVRTIFPKLGIAERKMRESMVAVHLVRVAEGKDGPSARVAFVAAIVSAMTGRAIQAGTTMTGEVALHGDVLAVGGLPQKLTAAANKGFRRVIISAENEKTLAQVPEDVRKQLEIIPVRTIQEAIEKILTPV